MATLNRIDRIVLRKEPKMDLTGQRFGKLTVLRKESKSKYRCFCDCGNELTLSEKKLNEGITSCGCLSSLNLRGNRYGRLVAKEPADDSSWLCRCGNSLTVSCDDLYWGTITSCGCDTSRSHHEDLTGRSFGEITVRTVSPLQVAGFAAAPVAGKGPTPFPI